MLPKNAKYCYHGEKSLIRACIRSQGGGRGTRILVLYTCVTRGFKTYPYRYFPSPGKTPSKREFCTISPANLPLNKLFWRTCFFTFRWSRMCTTLLFNTIIHCKAPSTVVWNNYLLIFWPKCHILLHKKLDTQCKYVELSRFQPILKL